MPVHLNEDDFLKQFPNGLDEFPTLIDREHYIDAWHLNTIFDSILRIEQYYLDHKESIEAASMDSFEGSDGELVLDIPPGRYDSGKTATASDANLVDYNIASGVTIFGVVGSLAVGGAGGPEIAVSTASTANGLAYAAPPSLDLSSAVPSVADPSAVAS